MTFDLICFFSAKYANELDFYRWTYFLFCFSIKNRRKFTYPDDTDDIELNEVCDVRDDGEWLDDDDVCDIVDVNEFRLAVSPIIVNGLFGTFEDACEKRRKIK